MPYVCSPPAHTYNVKLQHKIQQKKDTAIDNFYSRIKKNIVSVKTMPPQIKPP